MAKPLTPTQLAELRAMPVTRRAGDPFRALLDMGLATWGYAEWGRPSRYDRTPAGDALLATVDAEVERAIDDAMAIGEVIGEAREQKRVKQVLSRQQGAHLNTNAVGTLLYPPEVLS